MSVETVREWLRSASADLRNIEYILEDEFLTPTVAFHSQQCVEKCFKAILEHNGSKVPKDHSLIRLHEAVEAVTRFDADPDLLDLLSKLYTESRYPGDFGLLPDGKPSVEDGKEFYGFAKEIFTRVVENVGLDENSIE